MEFASKAVDFYKLNATDIAVVAIHILIIARLIVRWTPSTADDGILAKIIEIAKFFGLVIPDAELKAERRVANAGSVKIGPTRTAWVTTTTPDDDGLFKTTTTNFAPMAGRRRDERPLIRKLIQREARQNGITLTEEMEDAAIAELRVKHSPYAAVPGGKFRDFLTWLMEHREEILIVIRLVITIFAAEQVTEAVKP